MKKLVLLVLTVLSCGAAYALPVGNPSEAGLYTNGLWWNNSCCAPCDPCFSWCDAFSVRVGFYGDYVFNRHMQIHSGGHDQSDINNTQIYTNAGLLVLNICDWIDIFTTLGASDFSIFTDGGSFSSNSTMVQLDWATHWSWSVGGRATIWQCDCFSVGVEGQYFQSNPSLDSLIRYDVGEITYFNANNDTCYSEWQVGLGASYRWQTGCPGVAFIPYLAVKWAGSKFNIGDFRFTEVTAPSTVYTIRDLQSKKLWGYAVGLTATLCDAIGVTVEGRFADEKAVSVTSEFRF